MPSSPETRLGRDGGPVGDSGGLGLLALGPVGIAVHAGRADDNKALADHGLQLRDQLRDSLGRIDDLDHDRNVEGRILAGDIVELPVRAVAELDGEHGGAGQVPTACRLDDRAIERHSMPLLDGLGVDAEETRFGRDHHWLPSFVPRWPATLPNASTFAEID